jgi:chromosome segregation ATPase
MNPKQETNLERAVGRIEAQNDALAAAIAKLTEKAEHADEWRHEVKDRLEKIEARDVSGAFVALQQSIRDGRMQLKGAFIGVALAGGAAGATVATFIKALWAWVMGA